jgi:endonuclease/exonuclease/phosphatase family metal-dependent hydrolase
MLRRLYVLTVLSAFAMPVLSAEDAAENVAKQPLAVRVMSFNIRYGTAEDGADHWDKRKTLLLDAIRASDPDLLGMQEVLAEQADFLREQLSGYGFTGSGRDDGKRGGEYSPIMFKRDRFELLVAGQYWLSETPQKVGSTGWDAALPRIMTWARLKEKATGVSFLIANTHWDHVGNRARVESARLMRRLIDANRRGQPVIVTGDFNSFETDEQYKTLTAADKTGVRLIDAYREMNPDRRADEASFHDFKGNRDGLRIDWILHSPEWRATGAGIDHTERDGHYPSDHFPVTAEMELRASGSPLTSGEPSLC